MNLRGARARELVAESDQPTAVTRVAGISRHAIYKTSKRRPLEAGPGEVSDSDAQIVEVAKAHPTDGTRMVAAIASRQLGVPVNRSPARLGLPARHGRLLHERSHRLDA